MASAEAGQVEESQNKKQRFVELRRAKGKELGGKVSSKRRQSTNRVGEKEDQRSKKLVVNQIRE